MMPAALGRKPQILMQLKSEYILEGENADVDAGVPFLVTA
jgi:hypothetical protein